MAKISNKSGGSTVRNTSISTSRSTSQIRSRKNTRINSTSQKKQQESQFEKFDPKSAAGVTVGIKGAINNSSNIRFAATANTARAFSSRANIAGNVAKGVLGAISTPSAVNNAANDISRAIKTGNSQDVNRAVQSTASAGTTIANTVVGGLEAAKTGNIYSKAFTAAKATGASTKTARAAANVATAHALQSSSRQIARNGARTAATAATKASTRAIRRAVGKAAGNAAASAARTAARGTLAKTAGRFVPGLNVAIAGLDAAQAVSIQRDPNASTGKKVAGWVTAGASAVAATNIPVVSQIGAGVSVVSGFLRDLW